MEQISRRRAVEFAVVTEQVGRRFYEALVEGAGGDPEIRTMLERLARDEEAHERRFRSLLDGLPAGDEAAGTPEQDAVLRAMARSEFFDAEGPVDRLLDGIRSRDELLGRVVELEKATLGYYQALRDVLGEEPALEEIIAAEKQHLATAMRYLVTDSAFRGLGDDHP